MYAPLKWTSLIKGYRHDTESVNTEHDFKSSSFMHHTNVT